MHTFIIAQGLAEYGALASKGGSAGGGSGVLETARYRLESYVGQGNAPWFLGAVAVVVVLALVFRSRWSARQ